MTDLEGPTAAELFDHLERGGALTRLLAAARAEDLGEAGDVTTRSIIDESARARARLVARQDGIVSGLRAGPAVVDAFGARASIAAGVADGSAVRAGDTLATLDGVLVDMLALERTLLNLVSRLSGIATATRRCVDAVDATRAVICATRKTVPGLRELDKYAVVCGGGAAHRLGLYDAALYKDNHLAGIPRGGRAAALERAITTARLAGRLRFVEVEVDAVDELPIVLGLPPGLVDMVLLDNMSEDELRRAVSLRDEHAPAVLLEASGGITEVEVRAVAETGVDRISVGALTHSTRALDVALDVVVDAAPDAG